MLFEFLLVLPVMLGFWWVIRKDMKQMQRRWDAERRYLAARAARSGDHE